MIEAILVAAQLCGNCQWIHQYCVDRCSGPSTMGQPNPRQEVWPKKTECEKSRTELIDQAAKADRWVWSRCIEEPKSGKFNYLQE